ncbi:MAG TPA: glycoside hydrolase family 5 protein [Clostridiales bacterium]|nr:glycoside hydrolase family 5 protein [Clostridiales bacterium]
MFKKIDMLHCEGSELVNDKGKRIILRGTNLGGWLLREGWMDTGAFEIPVSIKDTRHLEECTIYDFGEVKRFNRIKIVSQTDERIKLHSSNDGITWDEICTVNLNEPERCPFPEGKPVPYDISGKTYNFGTYLYDGKICFNEVRSRFVKLECESSNEISAIMRYGDVDEFISRKILEERFGKQKMEELLTIYKKAYISDEDLEEIKKIGFNLVRIPIYWQEIMNSDGSIKESAFSELDWLIEKCREKEIYVMLDYHGAPGGHTSGSITCGQLDFNEFWNKEEYQDMSCRIIKALVNRYKDEPTIAAFDLLNEPAVDIYDSSDKYIVDGNDEHLISGEVHLCDDVRIQIQTVYQKLYDAARSTGDMHILSVQPFIDNDLLGNPEERGWEQVIYQIHCYASNWRDHDEVERSVDSYIAIIKKYQNKWKVPVLIGEFCFWEFLDVWEYWLDGLEIMGVSWSNWNYKNIDPNIQDNWACRYHFKGEFADLLKDSYETICYKWGQYSSNNYETNVNLMGLLSKKARAGS